MSCVPRKTERDTELCGQEVSWGALSGSTPAGNEESRTRERRKLNCDAAITWAALEPARPLRIVLNGGKGARALCPRIDQSLDAGCHLRLVHGLGQGGSLQLQVIFCEGPSCVLSITNRLRAPTLKGGGGMVQSWAMPHSILPASYFPSLCPSFLICQIPAPGL